MSIQNKLVGAALMLVAGGSGYCCYITVEVMELVGGSFVNTFIVFTCLFGALAVFAAITLFLGILGLSELLYD